MFECTVIITILAPINLIKLKNYFIMKKITLLMAALFMAVSMNAQEIVYQEDFEAQDLTGWTLYDEDGDGNNWGDMFTVNDSGGNPVTPVSLISRSWQGAPLTPDNWAVTPAIDLTAVSGNIELTWKVMAASNPAWNSENYTVYAATSTDISDFLASDVFFNEVYAGTGEQQDKSLDLSDLAGEVIYIAFRHHDVTDMDFLSIDDLEITGEVLSVSDVNIDGFNQFYSPQTKNLTISANDAFSTISIFNVLGQEVVSKNLSSNNEVISLSSLKDGIYIANVTTSNQKTTSFKIAKR